MKRSMPKLDKLSHTLSSHTTYYKFNKIENLSNKYRRGRINAAIWLNELIYYYNIKESKFIDEFKEQIEKQKKELDSLEDGEFKQGLYDELNIIEEMVNK